MTRKIQSINTNYGWHLYYTDRYNKHKHEDAAILAMYYLFNHLKEQDELLTGSTTKTIRKPERRTQSRSIKEKN